MHLGLSLSQGMTQIVSSRIKELLPMNRRSLLRIAAAIVIALTLAIGTAGTTPALAGRNSIPLLTSIGGP